MDKYSIIIVDDDRATTFCLLARLKKMKQVERVDTATSAIELLQKYLPYRPYSIVYLDQYMPGMLGTEAALVIREKYPECKVIFHTAVYNPEEAKKIFNVQPHGWLWKDFLCADAELSVEMIMRGHRFYSKEAEEIHQQLFSQMSYGQSIPHQSDSLTKREIEVLVRMCKLRKTREIADELFIDVRTAETHRNSIHKKTNLKKTEDLIVYAMEHGYIPKY